MNSVDFDLMICQYVDEHIVDFHQRRIDLLKRIDLETLFLTRNFYLFKAKRVAITAGELIRTSLDNFLFPLEEELFGEFLRGVAIFIASNAYGGCKSSASGVDFEFIRGETLFLISVESTWEAGLQRLKLEQELENTRIHYEESWRSLKVQLVLGICYGKIPATDVDNGSYLVVAGQDFWHLISGNKRLYTELIDLVGYRALEHNSVFDTECGKAINRLLNKFGQTFLKPNGEVDIVKLVEFQSSNFDSTALPIMTI